jgi:peptide/nickel transport system ATP-binding protein
MQKLCANTGTALIWITHDLSVVAGLADDIAVMYAGRIVEYRRCGRCPAGHTDPPLHPWPARLRAVGNKPGQPLMPDPGDALAGSPAARLRLPRPLPARPG